MKETKIAVAFLESLGFSRLLKMSQETANDMSFSIDRELDTRFLEKNAYSAKEHKDDLSSKKELLDLKIDSEKSLFKHLINSKNSLMFKAEYVSLLVDQLSSYIFALYVESFKPFATPFDDLHDVCSKKHFTMKNDKTIKPHKAFPILLRGGLSYNPEKFFFNESYIPDEKAHNNECKVTEKTSLKTTKFKEYGKGARLFCDKSLVDSLEDKSFIRIVNKNDKIYEIVWFGKMIKKTQYPYDIFSDPFDDLNQALTATINLVKYYEKTEPEVLPHYKESLKLICRGIVRHVDIYHDRKGVEDITESINKQLERNGLEKFTAEDLLDGFL